MRSPFANDARDAHADGARRRAIARSLDAVVRQVGPLAASFLATGSNGATRVSAVHTAGGAMRGLERMMEAWERESPPLHPLALRRLAGTARDVVTFDDFGGAASLLARDPRLGARHRELGAIDDVRLLVRSDERIVAAVAPWRTLADGWSTHQLRVLGTLQPLIAQAYRSACFEDARNASELLDAFTQRERQTAQLLAVGATNAEVARALHVSADTAKSHTRAVLGKLGVSSRRDVVLLLGGPRGHGGPGPVPVEGGGATCGSLLRVVLAWAAERFGAVAGGCAVLSPRLDVVAGATATTPGSGMPPSLAARTQTWLLPPGPCALARSLDADPLRSAAVQLAADASKPGGTSPAAELAAAGLDAPLVVPLRAQGRIVALLWLLAPLASIVERPALGALREMQPLLELACARSAEACLARMRTTLDLRRRRLTARELAVAEAALSGASNAEIAQLLGIAEPTAKTHMTRILAKCGVRSRTQLIALFASASPSAAPPVDGRRAIDVRHAEGLVAPPQPTGLVAPT